MTASLPLTITFPWPPSVNTYWRHPNGFHLISKRGRAYRKAAAGVIWEQMKGRAPRISSKVKVNITAHRPDKRVRDLDNLLKCALDALVHVGVLLDDSQIVHLSTRWATEIRKGGSLDIHIEAAGGAT